MTGGSWICVLSLALACWPSCASEVALNNLLGEDGGLGLASQVKHRNHSDLRHERWFAVTKEDEQGCPPGTVCPGFAEHWKGPRPSIYRLCSPIAVISALTTCVISMPCLWRLGYSGERIGPGRILWIRSLHQRFVAAAPLVVALTKTLGIILFPCSWKWLFFILAVYEAVAFWCFFQIVSGFVADTWRKVEDTLMQEPPMRIWAVPPCCCIWVFCLPCMVPRPPQWSDLIIVRLLLLQLIIFTLLVAAMEAVELAPRWLHLLEVGSLLCGVYGLFAMLKMTDHLLGKRRSHSKFWTLKGTVIASTFIFRAISLRVNEGVQIRSLCYSSETLAAAYAGTVTAILTMPLACVACYAFPAADLDVEYTLVSSKMSLAIQE